MTTRRVIAVLMVVSVSAVLAVVIPHRTEIREVPAVGQPCTLKVDGMACGACANRVEKIAMRVAGVLSAHVSHERGIAAITYDPAKTTPLAIARAITDSAGFKSEVAR